MRVPASSVMMSKMLGASFGGTTRGAHQAFESRALSLISPPKGGFGAGSCFPSIAVVALGEELRSVFDPRERR